MDLHSLTSGASLEKLKCATCSNYLSYFPIRVCDNNQSICGRCITPAENLVFQNAAFEALCQFLKFPCRYNTEGCSEEHQPKSIPQHETNCTFKIVSCPVKKSTRCEWIGPRTQISSHCETAHLNMFLTNEQLETSLSDYGEKYFLVKHEDLVLIFMKNLTVNKILKFELYTGEFQLNVKTYKCQLSVKCGSKCLSVEFNSTSFEKISSNELNLESIISQGDDKMNIKIIFGEAINDPDRFVNVEMLSILKCFVCSEYSVPPIYHCVNNNTALCSDCKITHQSSCNSCLRNSASTRNINLDRLAQMLNYPCKFQANGCTYVSKPDKIKIHESVCDLGDFVCPIHEFEACNWKGLWNDLEEHIQNNHQELVTSSSQLSKQLLPQRMKCDIIKFSNQLFRLVCLKTTNLEYMWTVQVIGPAKSDFVYEIEILDPSNKGRRLLMRQKCVKLMKREQLFKHEDSYCFFLQDQMQDFVVDQVVTFKVHIFSRI